MKRRGLLLQHLASLSDAEILSEIGLFQWELVTEAAQAAYAHYPQEDRAAALRTLQASESAIDRYAAQLAQRWIKESR